MSLSLECDRIDIFKSWIDDEFKLKSYVRKVVTFDMRKFEIFYSLANSVKISVYEWVSEWT